MAFHLNIILFICLLCSFTKEQITSCLPIHKNVSAYPPISFLVKTARFPFFRFIPAPALLIHRPVPPRRNSPQLQRPRAGHGVGRLCHDHRRFIHCQPGGLPRARPPADLPHRHQRRSGEWACVGVVGGMGWVLDSLVSGRGLWAWFGRASCVVCG